MPTPTDPWALTPNEETILLDNSLERVINTAREVVLHAVHEDAGMNYDDLTNVKYLATKLWDKARDEVFRARLAAKALDESTKAVQAMLDRALSLPFDEALPLVRKCLSSDYKLIWTPALAKWCATHHKAIAIIVEGKK